MKILVVDGNNLAYRAFGRAPLTYNGQRTEVIKIGLMMLRSYLENFRPDCTVVIWDGGHNKYRVALYPEYKKKKEVQTEIEKREMNLFFQQLDLLNESIRMMGIDQIRCRGQEADDVIFTLVKRWGIQKEDSEVLVVSTDQDMFQLFLHSKKVKIFSPIKEVLYENQGQVAQELEIPLKYYLTYKAAVGDPSDNLPGIKGIGPKKAKDIVTWLECGVVTPEIAKILEKWDEDTFQKMCSLIQFIEVPESEIRAGWTPASKLLEDMYLSAIHLCEVYGFEQWQDSMASFTDPFDKYLRAKQKQPTILGTDEISQENA